jgi:hypothetical protein
MNGGSSSSTMRVFCGSSSRSSFEFSRDFFDVWCLSGLRDFAVFFVWTCLVDGLDKRAILRLWSTCQMASFLLAGARLIF